MDAPADGLVIRQALDVAATPETAFRVFAGELMSWWPVRTHSIGDSTPVALVIEPFAGGRWFERAADGAERDWGRVLAYDPPRRLLLAWKLSHAYAYDEAIDTEVEIRFAAAGPVTRVEFEHRGLEAYGDDARERRASMGEGWPMLLARFAEAAAGA